MVVSIRFFYADDVLQKVLDAAVLKELRRGQKDKEGLIQIFTELYC